jgi:L-fuconolactonase
MFAESALEPELPVIDTHHHLWPAKSEEVILSLPYSSEDLHRDVNGGHNIVASIYVECLTNYRKSGPEVLRPVGETEWLVRQPTTGGLMSGIVGFADLQFGVEVGRALDAHLDLAGSRFKGVRHSTLWHPDPGVYASPRKPRPYLLLEPGFGAGLRELAKRGLVYEAWLYFHQLVELRQVARANPDLTIVLCHLGGPLATGPYQGKLDEARREWRGALRTLAVECPNVVIKLGGIGIPAFGTYDAVNEQPTSADVAALWKDDFLFCIDAFSPGRCMLASNFPVDSRLLDYVSLWNAFKIITRSLDTDDRRRVFEGTARRLYKLS